MSKDNGGAAFPAQPIYHYPDGSAVAHAQNGMFLRDYFAAKAMQGLLANTINLSEETGAKQAYLIADAMLKARNG